MMIANNTVLDHSTAEATVGNAKVTASFEEVTPDLAQEWLDRYNTHNRRMRKNHVAQLTRDLQADQFLFTGDTIKFDWNEVLLDGQHRLAGIAQSGKTEVLLVVRGLDPRSQTAIDINSRRLAYDALKLQGVQGDMKNSAAIARGVFMYDIGRVPTHLETIAFVEENADALEEATMVSEMVRRHGELTGGSFYGTAFYLLARIDRLAAHDFFEKLASGAELPENSPILRLRKKLSRGLPFGFGRGQWHLRQNFALVVLAWNYWRDGKEVKSLQMPKGDLPVPH